MNATKDQLEYVISLRNRVINQAHENGVTKWALGVAILYLLLQALPSLAQLKYSIISPHSFLLFLTHTLGTLVGASWLYNGLKGTSKFSKYDYRFRKRSLEGLLAVSTGFVIFEGVFLIASLICVTSDAAMRRLSFGLFGNDFQIQLNSFEYTSLLISSFLFIAFFLSLIAFMVFSFRESSKPDTMPSGLTLSTNDGQFISLFFNIAFPLALISTNAFYLFYPSAQINVQEYEKLILFSFQLGLILLGIAQFIRSITNSKTLELLNKLERDIVLHGISDEEIKLRLEDEYFGSEFQYWMKQQISNLKENSANLDILISQDSEFEKDLERIGSTLKFERQGRIREYQESITSKLNELIAKKENFEKCLSKLLNHSKSDRLLTEFIKNNLTESNDVSSEVIAKANVLLKKLKLMGSNS